MLWATMSVAQAQPAGAGEDPWQVFVRGGAVHQFDSDLDGGGEYSVDRAAIELGLGYATGPRDSVGLSLGYSVDDYSFDGAAGFGGLDPWGEIREYQLSASVRRGIGENFDLFALPFIRWSAEDGGDRGDAMTTGLVAGLNYRVSDRLRIGPGFGAFDEIEGGVSAFPILLIDWQITDTLSLETGSGLAATRGPGLALNSTAIDRWTFGLGARYENFEFRLDESGAVPDGVGEEEAVLTYLSARYEANPAFTFSALVGMEVGGQLTLRDANGLKLQRDDADPAPFVGIAFRGRF
jgi:hypothetical protein